MEKLPENNDSESEPKNKPEETHMESGWDKIKSKMATAARLSALLAVLGGLTYRYRQLMYEPEADRNVDITLLPDSVQSMLEKWEANEDVKISPQVTKPKGDVIVHLAQLHTETAFKNTDKIDFSDANPTIKCQKRICEFSKQMLELSKTSSTRVVFLNEGQVTSSEGDYDSDAASYMFEDLLKADDLEAVLKDKIDSTWRISATHKECSKYAIMTRLLRMAADDSRISQEKRLKLSSLLEARLQKINMNMVYYESGMAKFAIETGAEIQPTEKRSTIDEAWRVTTSNSSRDEIERVHEKRETEVVEQIKKLEHASDPDDKTRTVYVLSFGRAHDFYNNVENKDLSLVQIDMAP